MHQKICLFVKNIENVFHIYLLGKLSRKSLIIELNMTRQLHFESVILNNKEKILEYPTLSDRVQSTFIDTIFILLLMFVFASVLEGHEGAPDWIRIALFLGILVFKHSQINALSHDN
jgi:hypothetical protein